MVAPGIVIPLPKGLPRRLGYTARASSMMLRHPLEGLGRIEGRLERRRDRHALKTVGTSAADLYESVPDWKIPLHSALDIPWPCDAAPQFDELWEQLVDSLLTAGLRVGRATYGGWDDANYAFAHAVWCLAVHQRPANVVETGVARGVTSRVILEALERNATGQLWSIDLPSVDPAFHSEIGTAVSDTLRGRWTYVRGSSRKRLGDLLAQLGDVDLFVHDSLHTGRNVRFELTSVWPALRSGGAVVVDDVELNLGFHAFVHAVGPRAWFVAPHTDGRGLWGVAVKR